MLQGWVVINHKSSNYLAFKGNPHKLPVKNLINLFRRERLLYLKVIALFFCSRYFNIVLYSPFSPSTWNKRHNFQFIRKPKNLINDKISICLFNIYMIVYVAGSCRLDVVWRWRTLFVVPPLCGFVCWKYVLDLIIKLWLMFRSCHLVLWSLGTYDPREFE